MKVVLSINGQGFTDITNYVSDVSISGDITQVSRQADINILYPNYDTTIAKLNIGSANTIQIYENDIEIYKGYVWTKDCDSSSNTVKLTCYDWLIYMTKSQTCKNFKQMTPEAITAQVAAEFGVPVGNLASTGDVQNYVANNETGYKIMMTTYTHAAKINGKKYYPIVNNGALDVIEKGTLKSGIVFNGDNISNVKTSESIDSMVNKAIVYDNNQSIIATAQNTDWQTTYGILQTTLSQDEKKDNQKMAEAALKGVEYKVQLELPGNIYLRTGYAVDVNFPLYGINSTLFIESDKHEFSNGIYTTQVTLSYTNDMDEQESNEDSQS